MRIVDEAAQAENFSRVKHSVSCLDISQYETELRHSGGTYRGKCPIHGGTNPTSFVLVPNGDGFFDSFTCFSCGKSGDVIDLHAALSGPFRHAGDAMADLAEKRGVVLTRPEELMTDSQLRARKARRRAERAFDEGVTWFVFKRDIVPLTDEIEDPAERKAFLDECMKAAGLARSGLKR